MAIKSVSIRIEDEMLRKIGYVADYLRKRTDPIEGDISPDVNVKPAGRN